MKLLSEMDENEVEKFTDDIGDYVMNNCPQDSAFFLLIVPITDSEGKQKDGAKYLTATNLTSHDIPEILKSVRKEVIARIKMGYDTREDWMKEEG